MQSTESAMPTIEQLISENANLKVDLAVLGEKYHGVRNALERSLLTSAEQAGRADKAEASYALVLDALDRLRSQLDLAKSAK